MAEKVRTVFLDGDWREVDGVEMSESRKKPGKRGAADVVVAERESVVIPLGEGEAVGGAGNGENGVGLAEKMVKAHTLPEINQGKRIPASAWKPGQSGNPAGRPPRAKEVAAIEAINFACPPEEITRLLQDAMRAARETNSWRGMVAVATLVLEYKVGKPVQRVQSVHGSLQDLLQMVSDNEAGNADELTDRVVGMLYGGNG